jgi:hypothetical protein
MRSIKILALLSLATVSLVANAQFSQPWTPNAKGFTTRIPNCSTPYGLPGMAVDDFVCPSTITLTKLVYWGNVSGAGQLTKPVYVSIYPNTAGACFPDLSTPLYTACLTPSNVAWVGTDCLGRRVFRFKTLLTGGFTATGSTQYWLQISENDSTSLTPNADDFKWCGHFGIVGCPAAQISPTGVTVQPLIGCSLNCDLAFRIG